MNILTAETKWWYLLYYYQSQQFIAHTGATDYKSNLLLSRIMFYEKRRTSELRSTASELKDFLPMFPLLLMTQQEMLCQEELLQKRVKHLYFALQVLWMMWTMQFQFE